MPENVALAFTTINRPYVVQRLIRSIRQRYTDLRIYVADQSRHVSQSMLGFYRDNRVELLRMPYDCGVTVARNALVSAIQEDYFLLCDDDFIFNEHTDFGMAADFLRAHQDFGVVGGHLRDWHDGKFSSRHWELNLYLDAGKKLLAALPISMFAPSFVAFRGHRFFVCDAVMNFALFRRAIFREGAGWDERFKSNGEHEDFFLNLKQNTRFRVAYFPGLTADHHHPPNLGYARLRLRNLGWKLFFEKWGITQYLDYGWGLRTLRQLDTVHQIEDVRSGFFLSSRGRIDLTGAWGLDKIHVEDDGTVYGNNLTDHTLFGSTNGKVQEPRAWVSLQTSTGRIVVGREPNPTQPQNGRRRDGDVAGGGERAFDANSEALVVRYVDCLFDDDDFVVFLSAVRPGIAPGSASRRTTLDLSIRWSCCERSFRTWESAPHRVEIHAGADTAVLLPRPAPVGRMEHMLFDISSTLEPGGMPIRLATGVVRVCGGRSKPVSAIVGRDVSALSFAPMNTRRRLDSSAGLHRGPDTDGSPGFSMSSVLLGKDRLVRGACSGGADGSALLLAVRGAGGNGWADCVDLGLLAPVSAAHASPGSEAWFGAGAVSVIGWHSISGMVCG